MFDVLIKNGNIVDGAGNCSFHGDIGIVGEEIAKIGRVEGEAKRVIDAKGKVVCPGFCDPHAHPELNIICKEFEKDWSFPNWLLQGVTTLITSNCGQGVIPSEAIKRIIMSFGSPREALIDDNWDSVKDFVELVNKKGIGPNFAPLAGHWALRKMVLPPYPEDKVTTKKQLEEMKALLEEQMVAGLIGFSVGLSYNGCRFTSKNELVELAKAVAKYGGVLSAHTRGIYSHEASLCGIREIIDISRTTDVPINISHLGYTLFEEVEEGKTPQVLRLIEEAKKEGIDVTFDAIPHASDQWSTEMINSLLTGSPPHIVQSMDELAESWKDATFREMAYQEIVNIGDKCPFDYAHCYLLHPDSVLTNTGNPNIEGLTFGEIAKVEGVASRVTKDRKDILSLLVKLALDGCKGTVTYPLGVDFQQAELARIIFFDSPYCMPCSDAQIPEMKAYSTFPKYFRDRINRGVSLPEIVRHMTSLPCHRFGLFDRGLLAAGQKADVAILNPDDFNDNTTITDPTRKPSGIDFVLVNGSIVVDNGQMTGAKPGRILFRH